MDADGAGGILVLMVQVRILAAEQQVRAAQARDQHPRVISKALR
jgi:hypothetical protein